MQNEPNCQNGVRSDGGWGRFDGVPWVIDYQIVLERLRGQGLKCHYFHSGAFGFPDPRGMHIVGWTGPEDSTIRAEMRALTQTVPEPYEQNLSGLFLQAWQKHLPGAVWVMPASHWAYELDFGSKDWMPQVLENIGIDPGLLQNLNNAAAIEFAESETEPLHHLLMRLLERLDNSDFTIAFPGRSAICTVHHHKQLWWTTNESSIADSLRSIVEVSSQ